MTINNVLLSHEGSPERHYRHRKNFGKSNVEPSNNFNFLGIDITIRKDKKIEIEIKNQILEAIDWFDEEITKNPDTLANTKLLSVYADSTELDDSKSEVFILS